MDGSEADESGTGSGIGAGPGAGVGYGLGEGLGLGEGSSVGNGEGVGSSDISCSFQIHLFIFSSLWRTHLGGTPVKPS